MVARQGAASPSPALAVSGLSVEFASTERTVHAVRDVSFDVGHGETVAIVGESGSGKSVTALALMRLVEHGGGRIVGGRLDFARPDGSRIDLAAADAATMRTIRGAEIAMIFQEPMTSLNPVFTVGEQIAESIRLHQRKDRAAAAAEALRMLEQVRIPEAAQVRARYPHQLSGGMRQRVMIAMALSCRPTLLIADEPTTALDVTIQAQILALIRLLQEEMRMAVIFITHDMGVVAEVADRVVVMWRGEEVEAGPAQQIFAAPAHPYTQALLSAVPRLHSMRGTDAPRRFALLRVDGGAPDADAAAAPPAAGPPLLSRAPADHALRRQGRLSRPRRAPRPRGRAGELRPRRRRDAGAGRRIGLRQVDDRALAAAPGRPSRAAASSTAAATSPGFPGATCAPCDATSR